MTALLTPVFQAGTNRFKIIKLHVQVKKKNSKQKQTHLHSDLIAEFEKVLA